MRFPDPIPMDRSPVKIELDDGRIARVVEQHHASPRERWQMLQTMMAAEREYRAEGHKMSWRKRLAMNFMFLGTVLNPNCKACWYEVTDAPTP